MRKIKEVEKVRQEVLEEFANEENFQYTTIEAWYGGSVLTVIVDGHNCHVNFDPVRDSIQQALEEVFEAVRRLRHNLSWFED